MTKTFKIGQTYSTRSACDHECIFSFTVKSRSNKFLVLSSNQGEKRVGVFVYDGTERAMPYGRYSMAPQITAE